MICGHNNEYNKLHIHMILIFLQIVSWYQYNISKSWTRGLWHQFEFALMTDIGLESIIGLREYSDTLETLFFSGKHSFPKIIIFHDKNWPCEFIFLIYLTKHQNIHFMKKLHRLSMFNADENVIIKLLNIIDQFQIAAAISLSFNGPFIICHALFKNIETRHIQLMKITPESFMKAKTVGLQQPYKETISSGYKFDTHKHKSLK